MSMWSPDGGRITVMKSTGDDIFNVIMGLSLIAQISDVLKTVCWDVISSLCFWS